MQRFGSRVREALATASEAISNAVVDNDPITVHILFNFQFFVLVFICFPFFFEKTSQSVLVIIAHRALTVLTTVR